MKSAADIESYMLGLGLEFEARGAGMWLVHDEGDSLDNVLVTYVDGLLIFHVRVAELPPGDHARLYRRLLELNATDLIHGAYGIEGNAIVMTDTLQGENLDLNEFQAALEAMSVSLLQHYHELKALLAVRGGAAGAGQEAR